MKKKALIFIVILCAAILLLFLGIRDRAQKEGDEKTIQVGAILPLTGAAAPYGESAQKGILLAVDLFNKKYSDSALVATVVFENSKGDVKEGLIASNTLRAKGINVIVGPMLSGVAMAVANKKEDDTLYIFPTATTPNLRGFSPYIYRTCVSDDAEGGTVANYYLNQKKATDSVGILHINNEYGLGLANAFNKTILSHGEEVVGMESYNASSLNYRDVITKVLQGDPSYIFLVGQKEQPKIIQQLREVGYAGIILGTTMFEDGAVFEIPESEGAIFSSRVLNNGEISGAAHPFFKEFSERYGGNANYYAATAFDAATVALETERVHRLNKISLTEAIRQIDVKEGATGCLIFYEKNDVLQDFAVKIIKSKNDQPIIYSGKGD
jgi:branched-chain amino acid transport system substrate-binding protein